MAKIEDVAWLPDVIGSDEVIGAVLGDAKLLLLIVVVAAPNIEEEETGCPKVEGCPNMEDVVEETAGEAEGCIGCPNRFVFPDNVEEVAMLD